MPLISLTTSLNRPVQACSIKHHVILLEYLRTNMNGVAHMIEIYEKGEGAVKEVWKQVSIGIH